MKLASLKTGGRDGTLILVSRDLRRYCRAKHIATLQQALEQWPEYEAELQQQYTALNNGAMTGEAVDFTHVASPLPRAYQWLDGSAYLPHVARVRKARGAEMPDSFYTEPLMYQGGSDKFLAPRDPIISDEAWGIDFESEVAVITDDVPQGITPQQASKHIRLVLLVNDISLRNLIPAELAKGFGFLHGKPPTAFSPVAVTPDELGDHWRDDKLHLPLLTHLNGTLFGKPDAGVNMQFSFAELIAHAAKTRPLSAGTIIGSGTVSNSDVSRGYSCLAEKRVLEIIATGAAKTPFMRNGDRVVIEMLDTKGESIFGTIEQEVHT